MKKYCEKICLFCLVCSLSLFTGCSSKEGQKLTVDEILKEHLETRFEEVSTSPALLISIRDRILHENPQTPGRITLPYIEFRLLSKEESAPENSDLGGLVIYTDFHVRKAQKFKDSRRMAWFIESPKPTGAGLKFLRKKKNQELFDKVFTCYRDHLEKGPPFVFTPVGNSDIPLLDVEAVAKAKSKMVSIIASEKDWAPGHKLRHKVVKELGHKIDGLLGRAYQPINHNSEGFMDYRYSIVIENRKQDFYFSEKILDCILCGAVPIYWGCPSIGKFFNAQGIIIIDSLEELERALENISAADYESRLKAIKENYDIGRAYISNDKWLRRELNKELRGRRVQ